MKWKPLEDKMGGAVLRRAGATLPPWPLPPNPVFSLQFWIFLFFSTEENGLQ